MVTPIDQGHSLPQSLSLAVGCVRWIPPQQDHTTWSPTRQPCGPGDRPYPPRPRSHLVTHIVRFVTHLARKSISELLHRKDSFSLYDCSNTRIWAYRKKCASFWGNQLVEMRFLRLYPPRHSILLLTHGRETHSHAYCTS